MPNQAHDMVRSNDGDGGLDPILTPVPYSPEEAERIRAAAHQHRLIPCPQCQRPLTYGPIIARGREAVREVYCPDCQRSVMVPGLIH